MLTAFDRASVQAHTATLAASVERCHSGEGDECMVLEDRLRHYAFACREYCDDIRRWTKAVFTGRQASDLETERLWKTCGFQLLARAKDQILRGRDALDRVPCYMLDWLDTLDRAADDVDRLLTHWVTPAPSVTPGPRLPIAAGSETDRQIRDRLAKLPGRPGRVPPTRQDDVYRLFGVIPPR